MFARAGMFAAMLFFATPLLSAAAQNGNHSETRDSVRPSEPRDSVKLPAGARYDASFTTRMLLGDTWRDLWITPIKVPVLDLRSYAGGLKPLKTGSGLQTRSLRFANPEGLEFVFRLADKSMVSTPPNLKGSFVDRIFRDQVSALHPGGALVAAPILSAGHVLHPTAKFYFMPDDTLLGQFHDEFAGKLGMIEEYPSVPPEGNGFGGALRIIDSEELLELLNTDPMQRVNSAEMLKARLVDILLSDNDRHAGQWKWARMSDATPVRWVPIPRDRDHALINFDGPLVRLAKAIAAPNLVLFEGSDMNLAGLTEHRGFDARMLADLNRARWDSVRQKLVSEITDSVIDAAVAMQPGEYQSATAGLAASIKLRRDGLQRAADLWYGSMARAPDIHATDAADHAIVTRVDDSHVDVRLEASGGTPYYERRFDAAETTEIRIFMHGGDDSAQVLGDVNSSILVRVIGGNGTNTLVDSSSVHGKRNLTRLYDEGETDGVNYGEDTLFSRRPMIRIDGKMQPPGPERGVRWLPRVGIGRHARLGSTTLIGFSRIDYGFRHYPYTKRLSFEAEYAASYDGWRVVLEGDRRAESSPFHFLTTARMSDFEVVTHRGLGNMLTLEQAKSEFYEARQRQWFLRPALGFALSSGSDISVGPVLQYSEMDSIPDRFISEERPYGFGDFGQVGARLNLHLDVPMGLRDAIVKEGMWTVFPPPLHRFLLDVDVTHYAAAWDVTTPFQSLAARAGASITMPLPLKPLLVMRGGGRMLFGNFPFHEAAYIGGRNAARSIGYQSFEGDASLYGSAEFRVRLLNLVLVLPLQAGPLAVGDAARVFVDGSSPGGWHAAFGGGLWVGLRDSPTVLTFTAMNDGGRVRYGMHSGLIIRY